MNNICINIMHKAIADTLKNAFSYKIYTQEIQQGFKEPCFFIEVIRTSQKRIGFRRHDRQQHFCIHYFPEECDDKNMIMFDTAEELYKLLEFIRCPVSNNLHRGSKMYYELGSGVLHFFVSYNYHLQEKHEDTALMDKVTVGRKLKYVK